MGPFSEKKPRQLLEFLRSSMSVLGMFFKKKPMILLIDQGRFYPWSSEVCTRWYRAPEAQSLEVDGVIYYCKQDCLYNLYMKKT